MKTWFAKIRISAALDESRQPGGSRPAGISRSNELRAFGQEMAALDRALKDASPKPRAPASLHGSIMRAVQAGQPPAVAQRPLALLRWLTAPAAVAIALLLIWQAQRHPARPAPTATQSLATAASALDMSRQMTRVVPSAVLGPLSEELERLNRDLDNTAKFLLASLP
jgi:hypothetical protein